MNQLAPIHSAPQDGPDPRTVAQPRAVGAAHVRARVRGGRSAIHKLRHEGSAKLLFPRLRQFDLNAVVLNTAGGVTGGDRFAYCAGADPGAALTLSTQAAERAYRAQRGTRGSVDIRLDAASGATLHWLPQETILFDGAALSRRIDADLASDARLLAVEPVILGRTAMGERVRDLRLSDQWRIRRDGRLVYADALRIHGNAENLGKNPAILSGAGAFAQVLLVAPDAEGFLVGLRALLPARAGASVIRPGVLAMRMVADDGFALRRALIPVLEFLRGAPLPTVWKM